MIDLFTDNWDSPPVLYDGDRLVRVRTTNPCDVLFAIWESNRMSADELDDELRRAIKWRKGLVPEYDGFEDVTDYWYGEEC